MARDPKFFEVPNLDHLTHDPAELDALADTLERLALYCHVKARATSHRLRGDIPAASTTERTLEAIYRQLPEWARW